LTVSGIQVSESPRKSLKIRSLGSSEKFFGTSNLYQLKHSVRQRRQFEENLASFLEYSFSSRLIHLSLITARLPLSFTFYRASLSLSLSRRHPHLSLLSPPPPLPYSLAAGDCAARASCVRGRASSFLGWLRS
jgi:hypothetical protein